MLHPIQPAEHPLLPLEREHPHDRGIAEYQPEQEQAVRDPVELSFGNVRLRECRG